MHRLIQVFEGLRELMKLRHIPDDRKPRKHDPRGSVWDVCRDHSDYSDAVAPVPESWPATDAIDRDAIHEISLLVCATNVP